MIDYITPIKEQLDEKMHITCALFVTIGFPAESPRYFNFKEFNDETKVLTIGSTQRQNLEFEVQTEYEPYSVDVTDFWNQFKEYRTGFLQEYYPTIDRY